MDFAGLQCPIPLGDYPQVTLAHGGGGRLTHTLIERMFLAAFRNPALETLHDGAVLEVGKGRIAVTTDSFVVSPRFFPGGDIGSLAVHGTVNDLAMCGARPFALTAGFVLEEGLPMDELWRIVRSMARAAEEAGVAIVTGDTKVVDRGKGDGAFINTTGLGTVPDGVDVSPRRACPGDVVLLSGRIAEHGVAVMSVREGLGFETTITSDSAALHGLVAGLLDAVGGAVHVLRDPTRGGVASALNEIAGSARAGIVLDEAAIPVAEEVRGACELLGLDPLYVANEGKCLAIVEPAAAGAALAALRAHPLGREAVAVGEVVAGHPGRVHLRSRIGGTRVVDMLSGEQLPRIC
ncbi:MAG: hydrogenase expression/formation protein HypE [Candidatus Eisenbacteria bacterium]|nr:hydrogenase expression/formation protein HypE [Candidatus Eisenbacteria bacterium]